MDRVRLGVIGCGSMSRHHGRIFAQSVPEAEIVALVEPDANNLARYIAEIFPDGPSPATFSDYRAMLAEATPDAVLIVSPHSYHFQQVIDSIDAGCHVLVEKPMVIRTEDAQALIAHASKHDKIVSVAFPGPFSCEFQYIRDLIARGDLGEIYMITGVCAQNWLAERRRHLAHHPGAGGRRQPVRQRCAYVQRHALPDRPVGHRGVRLHRE